MSGNSETPTTDYRRFADYHGLSHFWENAKKYLSTSVKVTRNGSSYSADKSYDTVAGYISKENPVIPVVELVDAGQTTLCPLVGMAGGVLTFRSTPDTSVDNEHVNGMSFIEVKYGPSGISVNAVSMKLEAEIDAGGHDITETFNSILELIPEDASPENQLATKADVANAGYMVITGRKLGDTYNLNHNFLEASQMLNRGYGLSLRLETGDGNWRYYEVCDYEVEDNDGAPVGKKIIFRTLSEEAQQTDEVTTVCTSRAVYTPTGFAVILEEKYETWEI